MIDLLLAAVVPIVIVGFAVFFILLPRYGPHYTSRLTCPHCRKQFNFHWVPGATLTSLRYGNRRRLHCPYCNMLSTFEIAKTRISKTKSTKPQSKQ
ncbi:MAG: hypothetical protein ACBZ72_01050 [Candidatus Bathyarchaeia archaeon]|jgi:hypothetical protein